jgi:hypothetical protein
VANLHRHSCRLDHRSPPRHPSGLSGLHQPALDRHTTPKHYRRHERSAVGSGHRWPSAWSRYHSYSLELASIQLVGRARAFDWPARHFPAARQLEYWSLPESRYRERCYAPRLLAATISSRLLRGTRSVRGDLAGWGRVGGAVCCWWLLRRMAGPFRLVCSASLGWLREPGMGGTSSHVVGVDRQGFPRFVLRPCRTTASGAARSAGSNAVPVVVTG